MIKINENVIVPCPKINFALRKAIKCLACEHYLGLTGDLENATSADQLQVICGLPITRRLGVISEE